MSQRPDTPLRPEWLRPGHTVLNVHTRGCKLPDIIEYADLVSCDSREPVLDRTNGLVATYPDLNPDFELGDVVAGTHPGRESPDQVVFSFNYGLGVFDLLLADRILSRLRPSGLSRLETGGAALLRSGAAFEAL